MVLTIGIDPLVNFNLCNERKQKGESNAANNKTSHNIAPMKMIKFVRLIETIALYDCFFQPAI